MHCEKYPKLSALQNTINGYHDNNNNPYNNHAKAKADTAADIKEIVDFAERFRYMLDVQINRYRIDMQKSNTHVDKDRLMIKIQALEWVQGQVQDIILNNVTRDWPVYDSK
ncbi:MAG: hypothetical protein ACJ71A_11930 [Nitrososphaeraceae archaeon]